LKIMNFGEGIPINEYRMSINECRSFEKKAPDTESLLI